jgi:hypothetical protein
MLVKAQDLITRTSRVDRLFVVTAIAFNLLISAIFITQNHQIVTLVRVFGTIWLLLCIPFAIVFLQYWKAGREPRMRIYLGVTFIYMFVELLLDYILKIEFRQMPAIHIPYIILEYLALFGLIGAAFAINRKWGVLVSLSFGILMISLAYLYIF